MIFKSLNKEEGIKRYNLFIRRWQEKEPLRVRTLKEDIEYCLA